MKKLNPNSVYVNTQKEEKQSTVVERKAYDKESEYLFDVIDIIVRTSKNDLNNENHLKFLSTNIHLQYRMLLSECNKIVNDGVALFDRLNEHAIPGVLDNIDMVIEDCIRNRSVKSEYRNMVLANIVSILKFMELPEDSKEAVKVLDFINYFFDSYEKINN